MGNCLESPLSSKEEHQIHDRIERTLKVDKSKSAHFLKMLLLGTGDSGKSTIAKQMRIIHLNGFSNEERRKMLPIIHENIVSYIRILTSQLHKFEYSYKNSMNVDHESYFTKMSDTETITLTRDLAEMIVSLWEDDAIKQTWERSCEFQISDSAAYFLPRAKEFTQMDYEVSDEDILLARVKTTGIVEIEFQVDNEVFRMVDVGGQRSERKKWIHCFNDVTALLFVVALNEYNLYLEENATINRMIESIKLFDDMINNMWFRNTSIILFLNKTDLFEEKIKKTDLKVCFPDYSSGNNCQEAMEFISQQYHKRNKFSERNIYPHFTCATDTDNIRHVWIDTKNILLRKVLDVLMPC
eukprot:TRINITY_DN10018_c0_g1_i1.p1 TRINITY_DN10018_c0_g1~~TRINITY_DN10018_c0_g1_i1.p1  ORF type:complete len:355 (-),score=43.04 TRINITY_DN10018_c0_g1_i1:127-1191(-)